MRTIAFASIQRSRRDVLVANYLNPFTGHTNVLRVEGWLTLEADDGTRHVVAAVADPQSGMAVPATDMVRHGWQLTVRLEIWGR